MLEIPVQAEAPKWGHRDCLVPYLGELLTNRLCEQSVQYFHAGKWKDYKRPTSGSGRSYQWQHPPPPHPTLEDLPTCLRSLAQAVTGNCANLLTDHSGIRATAVTSCCVHINGTGMVGQALHCLKKNCLAKCHCTTPVSSDGTTTRPRRSHSTVSLGKTEQYPSSEDLDLQRLWIGQPLSSKRLAKKGNWGTRYTHGQWVHHIW